MKYSLALNKASLAGYSALLASGALTYFGPRAIGVSFLVSSLVFLSCYLFFPSRSRQRIEVTWALCFIFFPTIAFMGWVDGLGHHATYEYSGPLVTLQPGDAEYLGCGYLLAALIGVLLGRADKSESILYSLTFNCLLVLLAIISFLIA